MILDIAETSLIGDRKDNEDDCSIVERNAWCFATVADGLGGSEGGQYASKYFCQALENHVEKFTRELTISPQVMMNSLFIQASLDLNRKLYELHYPEARTTSVAVWFDHNNLITAHVGDSRVYYVSDGQIKWRSRDHSYVQQFLDRSEITEEELKCHPQQNLLLRCISIHEPPDPEIHSYAAMKQGDTLILCTDGFWGNLHDNEIQQIASEKMLQAALNNACDTAYRRGSPHCDNITALVIRVEEI